MDPSTYPQTWPAAPMSWASSRQWLAAGIAGIAGGYVVASLVTGQLAYLISGRSGLPAEQGVLAFVQLVFGLGVVVAAYLLAPGPLPLRLIGTAVFVGGTVLTTILFTLRLTGTLRGGGLSLYLLNPNGLLLLAGAAGWLLAAQARPSAYLTLAPIIVVLVLPGALVRAGLSGPVVSLATLGLSLVVAVVVLVAGQPARR